MTLILLRKKMEKGGTSAFGPDIAYINHNSIPFLHIVTKQILLQKKHFPLFTYRQQGERGFCGN